MDFYSLESLLMPTPIHLHHYNLTFSRTYYLKGLTDEEAEQWYTTIKNKQVIVYIFSSICKSSWIQILDLCRDAYDMNKIWIKFILYYFHRTNNNFDIYLYHFSFMQVMGVPVENQDCNNNRVPYLIEKCVSYIEAHGKLSTTFLIAIVQNSA